MSERLNRSRSVGLVVLVMSLCLPTTAMAAQSSTAQAPKRILILYDEDRHDYPGLAQIDGTLRESFRSELGTSVELFSESMNLSQFDRPGYDLVLVDYFRRKYSGRTPDLIVAILEPSLDFLIQHGNTLFPGVPIVFGGVDASTIKGKVLPDHVTGVLVRRTFSPSLDVALRLLPETRQVFVVGGASKFDRYLQTMVRRDLQPFEGRIGITYLFGLSMDEVQKRLSSLPPNCVILYVTMLADGTGHTFVPHEAVSTIAKVANAPTFVFLDQFVGHDVVGGNVYSQGAHGTHVAGLGLQILRGASPSSLPIREIGAQIDLFDARQLARWNLDEARLPPGSVVRYRAPSLWATYRWYLIVGITVLIVEAALIGALSRAVIGFRRRGRQLVESEGVLQKIFDTAPTSIVIVRPPAYEIERANAVALEMLGISPTTGLGNTAIEQGLIPDVARRNAILAEVESGGRVRGREMALLRAGQDERVISINADRITLDSGDRIICSFYDLTDLRRAEEGLRGSAEEIRQLYTRLTSVEDDERRALHTELHGRVGANLFALRLELEVAASLIARDDVSVAQRHLASASEVAAETISMARDLMAELRPPALDDYGLVAALRTFAETQTVRLALPIVVTGSDLSPRPSRPVEGALFRIAQEAVMNAARHAAASRVVVEVGECDSRILLSIADDGVGFDVEAPMAGPDHWGLKNMRERARAVGGVLRVTSAPGTGTRITADVPGAAS